MPPATPPSSNAETFVRPAQTPFTAIFAIFEADGERLTFCNEAYAQWTGADPHRILGRRASEYLDSSLRPVHRQCLSRCQASGLEEHFEIRIGSGNQEQDWLLAVTPRRESGAQTISRYYLSGYDITASKNLDRSKDELIALVSHELRTPVTAISATVSLLSGFARSSGLSLPEKVLQLFEVVSRNCDRLVRLTSNFLDFSRLNAGRLQISPRIFDMAQLAQQVVLEHEALAVQNGVLLRCNAVDSETMINTDSDRVAQVLNNLLNNAIKFSPRGAEVETIVQSQGGRIRVSVCDRGAGVPPEFRKQIFQRFSQADALNTRNHEGAGLGLAISLGLAQALGGTLEYHPREDGGSIFALTLPQR